MKIANGEYSIDWKIQKMTVINTVRRYVKQVSSFLGFLLKPRWERDEKIC
jgi:hypothetical protein